MKDEYSATKTIVTALIALGLITSVFATGVVAHGEHSTTPALEFKLQDTGDAEVTLRLTYNLSSDEQQASFESIANNESYKSALANQTRERLSNIANQTSQSLNRSMDFVNTSTSIETVDQTGIVEITGTWTNLAAVNGNTLAVTEPFISGFETDRNVVVYVPSGYTTTTVTPEETTRQVADSPYSGRLVWNNETSFNGFELILTQTDQQTDTPTDQQTDTSQPELPDTSQPPELPGFTAVVALVALIATAVFIRHKN